MMKAKLEKVLKQYFGYTSFRPGQYEIISAVLAGKDTLAVMPTGGGKSLCYQIPALVQSGLTVVISPLIALMQDQVAQLDALGIPALFLNSSLDWDTYRGNMDRIRTGEIKLLYCAPETLVTERVQTLLNEVTVSCFTVDEAHCISEWGHDFRPEYTDLVTIMRRFPDAVCLALTATATDAVRKDIKTTLELGKRHPYFEQVASFNRPNIYLEVQQKSGKAQGLSAQAMENLSFTTGKYVTKAAGLKVFSKLKLCRADEMVLEFIASHKDESGIVYCFSRRQVDELTEILTAAGIHALPYHAGLTDEVRARNQQDFVNDDVPVIVATVAFGMGINKPNVRYVVHYDLPKSVEQYYQEIGRAGRDGEPSRALLLYSRGDTQKIRFFFNEKDPHERLIAERQLSAMVNLAECRTCRREALLAYFGEKLASAGDGESRDQCCDVCTSGVTAVDVDVTIPVQKLLSAILRTGERFGSSYVIDVLLGSRMKRVLENGHDKLSVYGIGKEYAKDDWMELVRLLIEAGFLRKSSDYQVLSLTKDARDTLRDRGMVMLPFIPSGRTGESYAHAQQLAQMRVNGKAAGAGHLSVDDTAGQAIYQELKRVRKRLAEESSVPPYVIFGDKTIEDVAVKKPRSREELQGIYGIGETKAERYGEFILRAVRRIE